MIDFSAMPVAAACLAGVVWAVRLEGKVGAHTQLIEEREKQVERLEAYMLRIETKLDNVLDRKR